MSRHTLSALALLVSLAACTSTPLPPLDFSAKNRPLEERCVRAQKSKPPTQPNRTQAEVQAEARAATQRGELDKACDWM
jgi:hypothetical protein